MESRIGNNTNGLELFILTKQSSKLTNLCYSCWSQDTTYFSVVKTCGWLGTIYTGIVKTYKGSVIIYFSVVKTCGGSETIYIDIGKIYNGV